MLSVRTATSDDAPALGRLHVRAWQAAYRGVMPAAYLESLRPEQREAMWIRILRQPREATRPMVAVEDELVVGMMSVGRTRDPDAEGLGEVYVINVDPAAWGQGVGRALLEEGTRWLASQGYAEALLWVVGDNARARRFYERAGWAPDGAEKSEDFLDTAVRELRYRRSLRGASPR